MGKFCSECGAPLTNAVGFCPECGKPVPDSAAADDGMPRVSLKKQTEEPISADNADSAGAVGAVGTAGAFGAAAAIAADVPNTNSFSQPTQPTQPVQSVQPAQSAQQAQPQQSMSYSQPMGQNQQFNQQQPQQSMAYSQPMGQNQQFNQQQPQQSMAYSQPMGQNQQFNQQQPQQTQAYQQPDPNEPIPNPNGKYGVVGTGAYFGYIFLFGIPIVGLVICLIMALGGTKNENKKHMARAYLIWAIIGIVVGALLIWALTSFIGAATQFVQEWLNNTVGSFSDITDAFGTAGASGSAGSVDYGSLFGEDFTEQFGDIAQYLQ